MTVDPLTATHRAEFGGTTFWFCSAGCKVEFEKTPERYLSSPLAGEVAPKGPEGTRG
jgi:Cu+-exporting ATPase